MTEEQRLRKNAQSKLRYLANLETIRQQHREYAAAHREEQRAYWAQYQRDHAEELKAIAAAYYAEHRAERRAYAIEHREEIASRKAARHAAHAEEDNAKNREYHRKHCATLNSKHREYYRTHAETIRAHVVAYQKDHPEQRAATVERRRAAKRVNTPDNELLTGAQWHDILEQYHHRCAYCGTKLDRPTMDHVIPLSRGGKHSKDNVVPACKHCNSSKFTKTPVEWRGFGIGG